jgi:hypothetical protein
VLTDADPKAENSLDEPQRVAPKTEPLSITGNTFTRVFPGNSLTVLRLPAAK